MEKSHFEDDMQTRFPGEDIKCRDCTMRKEGDIGYKNRYCECFPEGKPLDILFENAGCPYYMEDF